MSQKLKMTAVNFTRLTSDEPVQLVGRLLEDWDASQKSFGDKNDYPELFGYLRESYAAYRKGLDTEKKHGVSPELQAADHLRDGDMKLLRRQVASYELSSRPQDLADYQVLSKLLSDYQGIERYHLEKESSKIDSLLEKLKADAYQEVLDRLGLTRFVTQLTESQAAFAKLYKQDKQAQLNQESYDMKALRQTMLEDYARIVEYTALLGGYRKEAVFQDVYKVIEAGRKHYASILAHRTAKKKVTGDDTDKTPQAEEDK